MKVSILWDGRVQQYSHLQKGALQKQLLLSNLVVEVDGSVHVGASLLVVTRGLHHVLGVTEQSHVHQLVVQTVVLLAPEVKVQSWTKPLL